MASEILIVEDDVDVREALALFFEDEGYRPTACGDGGDVLQLLRGRMRDGEALPDLVLLDLMLPRVNGQALVRALQLDVQLAEVPVVVLTADPDGREIARQLRVAGCLTKPVNLQKLGGVVAKVLRPGCGGGDAS